MINHRITIFFYLLISILIFLSVQADENNCTPVYEINAEWQTFRLRPHENAFLSCQISQETFTTLIGRALSDPASDNIQYRSVFIGRLIEYPWLAQQLAGRSLQHPSWDAASGQAEDVNLNQFVVSILSTPDLLKWIQDPFTAYGYRVTGVSVEKVLVDHAGKISWLEIDSTGQVPYDAMVHFTLEQTVPP